MHYALITYGSRGDVQPYVALALALQKRGNEVTLAAPENFKAFIEGYGINFFPLYGNVEEILYSPEGLRALRTGNTISLLRYMQKGSKKMQPLINEDMLKCAATADVLVASTLTNMWVGCIAEKLDKKWAVIQLSSPATPTKEFPFAGLSFINAPFFNLFSHKLIRFIYWKINKKDINAFRVSLGLDVLKNSIINKTADENIPNLYAFSPQLIARPKDWKNNVDITGFLSLPVAEKKNNNDEEIMQDLNDWLQNGEKPVYIGFGSIPVPDALLLSEMINEIIAERKLRIIFCRGWFLVPNLPKHENLFTVEHVDHALLLPQCRVAAIHGGIGTIAACLKAKTPMIVASVFADQPWNGKLIANKKLGVHIPFKKLTAQKLLRAIARTKQPDILQNISAIGEAVNKEDGVKIAVDKLEEYFSSIVIPAQAGIS